MAAGLLQEITQEEHERARARSRKMWEMDMYSDYLSDKDRDELRGEERGMKRVIALLEKGLSLEEIKKMVNSN